MKQESLLILYSKNEKLNKSWKNIENENQISLVAKQATLKQETVEASASEEVNHQRAIEKFTKRDKEL